MPYVPAVDKSSTVMAALLAVGGVAGFAKARSVPSLVAGTALSALFLGAGRMIASEEPESKQQGRYLALGLSTSLAAMMGPRAISVRRLVSSLEVLPDGNLTRVLKVRARATTPRDQPAPLRQQRAPAPATPATPAAFR
eukprot:SAG22_NODE_183_length_16031_cov_36.647000_4_plen_139_part_00